MLRSVERQRADLLVRATQAGLLEWDAAADVTTYSERLKEMLGHAADADAARWQFFDLIHPEDRERIRASFLAQLRDRRTKGGVRLSHDPADYRLRRDDGSYIWIHAEAISLTGEDGRTLRYICSFIDISERKRQEEALKRSEERYDAAMHAVDQGVYDWNVLTGTIYYSDSVYRALGMPRSMKTPQDWLERVHPEDLPRYNAAIAAHFKGKTERFECEYRYRGPDGSWRWARQRGIATRNEQGHAVRMVGATGDITELKLAEIVLRDQMALTRAIVAQAPNAIFAKDREGRFTLANRGWSEMSGVPEEKAIGRTVHDLYPRTQRGDIEMRTSEAASTTLTVRLRSAPAPSAAEQAAAITVAAAQPAEPARGSGAPPALAVLVVDDDEYTRVVVQRFLPSGTRSRAASNGREALDAVIADQPDAVVMDLDMPVLGGIGAAARIREWERESGRPRGALIAMSSHDDAATRKRCMEAGFDAYLEKPVSPGALRRALTEFARAPLADDPVRIDRDLEGALPGFLDSRRELAAELSAALEAGDAERARAIAHKLAGSLALYGFRWAAGQGRMIERRARARALEGLADEVSALRRHLEAVKVEIAT